MIGSPSPLLISAIERIPAGRALDLACGTGRHAIFLAQRGWLVTAVDLSSDAIQGLRERAGASLKIDARVADLETGDFVIAADGWDLICDFCYLQRNLFSAIRSGIRSGGLFVAAICMVDRAPEVRPMNPAYLLEAGELAAEFAAWDILHYAESKRQPDRRKMAELIARKRAEAVP